MADHRQSSPFAPVLERRSPRLTRRHLLAGSGAAVATTTLAGSGFAQEATPATPAAVDPEAFRALCLAVTAATELDDAGLEQLLGLFNEDPETAAELQALLATGDDFAEVDIRDLPFSALVIVTNILQFWYLGNFRNEPLENRADRFPGLVAWQALPYVTNQTVCKGFGYWATDVDLPDRA